MVHSRMQRVYLLRACKQVGRKCSTRIRVWRQRRLARLARLKGMDRSSQNPQKFRLLEGGAEDWRTPEEQLKARVRYQEALVGLGKSALSEAITADLLDEAARVVAEVLSVEYCKILELSPDGTELLLRAGAGWKEGYVGRVTVGANLESQAGYA